jgi:cytochrome P450
MNTTVAGKELPLFDAKHWLFGSIHLMSKNPLEFLDTYANKYDGIFRVKSPKFLEQLIVVSKPDYVKHILQDNNKNYHKSYGYTIMKLLLGEGLLTSEGDFWRRQRRLAQPAFHRDRLATFVQIMTSAAEDLLNKWESLPDGTTVNISTSMMNVTVDIVCKAMFSTDVEDAVEVVNREFNIANEKLVRRITSPVKIPLWLPIPEIKKEKNAYSAIRGVVKQIIDKRRNSNEQYDDLLAMLMEAKDEDTGEMMSNEQILDEVVTIFLAGHETTAVALSWLFNCVEENPEVEEKLLSEEASVLNNRAPQLEDLRALDYTRMVIDETLRLYPPAWVIGRNALDDDEIGGYHIPKGINVLIPVYSIHRDARYWENPEQFIPERFSKEKAKNYHKFMYFPFGGGPRLCIGNNFALMEMQLIVPMILRKYKLTKPKGYTYKKDPLVTMRPLPEMSMVINKRKQPK